MNPSRLCEIEGCEAPHRAKGLCSTHYNADRYERLGGRPSREAYPDMEEEFACQFQSRHHRKRRRTEMRFLPGSGSPSAASSRAPPVGSAGGTSGVTSRSPCRRLPWPAKRTPLSLGWPLNRRPARWEFRSLGYGTCLGRAGTSVGAISSTGPRWRSPGRGRPRRPCYRKRPLGPRHSERPGRSRIGGRG